jgi:ornithine cyclodeaminase
MLLLGEADVRRCLSMRDCLEVNRRALQSIGTNDNQTTSSHNASPSPRGVVPTRLALPFEQSDWTLFKPAAYYDETETQMGLKVVSVRAKNPANNKPLVPATILLLDASTGEVNAMVSATYLTAARTAAGSALATRLCLDSLRQRQKHSTTDLKHLVVFGAGLQAECHIEAIHEAMQQTFQRITIVNRSHARAQNLRENLAVNHPSCQCDILLLDQKQDIQDALATADVVVATTNTLTPLWDGKSLKPGCHINGIGSYTPDMHEVDVATVDRCRVFIDTPEAKTVGDLKHLSERKQQHPIVLLGDALTNPVAAWESADSKLDCTFYKAVGTAIQDVMTATMVAERAKEMGVGTYVDMS